MTKSSISFRVCKSKIQVYRLQYGKQTRIFTLDLDLANAADLQVLLANEVEQAHWARFRHQHMAAVNRQWLQQLIDRGLDKVMGDIADALEVLAKSDPSGRQPKNRQYGYGIWHEWDRITRIVSSISHWGIRQAEAKEQLERRNKNVLTKPPQ